MFTRICRYLFLCFILTNNYLLANNHDESNIKLTAKNFDYSSIKSICKESNQVMVYGWSNCRYYKIEKILQNELSPIEKTFNFMVGIGKMPKWKDRSEIFREAAYITKEDYKLIRKQENKKIKRKSITLDGWPIEHLDLISKDSDVSRECKMGLVNVVFENYKRVLMGLPIIKIIFVLDCFDNDYVTDAKTVTSRKESYNSCITNKELRRCYKLCKELEYTDLHDLALVAQQSLVFVKLKIDANQKYILKSLAPVWEDPNWDDYWAERKASKSDQSSDDKVFWRNELAKKISAFNAKF